MKTITERGSITISSELFAEIAGHVALRCVGVRGMAARSVADGLVHVLKRENTSRGVRVRDDENGLIIELHVIVRHGVNIVTVGQSIRDDVSYAVEKYTGVKPKRVDVCIDSVMVN